MPGGTTPDTYRDARESGQKEEYLEKKRGPRKEPTEESDSFLKTDVAPGTTIAVKEIQRSCRLKNLSIHVKGLVSRGMFVLASLERGGQVLEWEIPISEGSNKASLNSLVQELKPDDLLELKLMTEGEDVTPLQRVLTTFVVTHD